MNASAAFSVSPIDAGPNTGREAVRSEAPATEVQTSLLAKSDKLSKSRVPSAATLGDLNAELAARPAADRVAYAFEHLPETHVLSSSFGAQAAVLLHMLTAQRPEVPVVLIDTGYLFPETYAFVQRLTERLDLNLEIFRAARTPAEQEAAEGRRWEQGLEGLEAYNLENKVEPMQRALSELDAGTWFTGLRRSQANSRADTAFVSYTGNRFKVAPIADWSDRDVHDYLKQHQLPYHPLWDQGYVSIGDVHSTRTLADAGSEELTRFGGLKRECGLHDRPL